MSPYDQLGARLKHACEIVNCDEVDVAESLSVDIEVIRQLFRGDGYPLSLELVVRVAELAGCELIPIETDEADETE